jgi:glycosyltransferase involved in cell wall biosynthesis
MGTTQPLVSVGIPVYNGENFLEAALDSILAQTYANLEIIICDNASTDRTSAICARYAARDKRVNYVRNEQNLGAAKNYNSTVELSQGKYFKWASHDDICAPKFIEHCVAELEREPAVVLAYPKTIVIDGHGNIRDEEFEDHYDIRGEAPHERYREFTETPLDCNPVFGVIRMSALMKTPCIGAYESSDRVLLGELALLGRIHEVPERLFYRRYHKRISTYAHTTKESMAAWFDPHSRGKFTRLRRFVEYLRSLYRVPLSFSQRAHCLSSLLAFYGRFYFAPTRVRRLMQSVQLKFHRLFPIESPTFFALKKKEVF